MPAGDIGTFQLGDRGTTASKGWVACRAPMKPATWRGPLPRLRPREVIAPLRGRCSVQGKGRLLAQG